MSIFGYPVVENNNTNISEMRKQTELMNLELQAIHVKIADLGEIRNNTKNLNEIREHTENLDEIRKNIQNVEIGGRKDGRCLALIGIAAIIVAIILVIPVIILAAKK